MNEVWIILFCVVRFIITKYLLRKKQAPHPSSPNEQNASTTWNDNSSEKQSKQSSTQVQIRQLKYKKSQIQATIEQFNNPSTFAKYSKMQRQLSKISNQLQALQAEAIRQQANTKQQSTSSQNQTTQKQKMTLFELKKREVQNLHGQILDKGQLLRAFVNLGLILAFSYMQSSQISLCASYPLYQICSSNGTVNGGWIFVMATVLLSH